MKVFFINHHGGGFADYVDVPEGTTVEQFFKQRLPSADPANYLIRIDRQPAGAGELLREGQRVSFTPTKIEGANDGAAPSLAVSSEISAPSSNEIWVQARR
jgi:hypothetical protein